MLHIKQYLRLFCSGLPRWKPQKTGTWPGSVVIAWTKDQHIIRKKMWNTTNIVIVGASSDETLFKEIWIILTGLWEPYEERVRVIYNENYTHHKENKHVAYNHIGTNGQFLRHISRFFAIFYSSLLFFSLR